jgi:L-rhamnose mutarotase
MKELMDRQMTEAEKANEHGREADADMRDAREYTTMINLAQQAAAAVDLLDPNAGIHHIVMSIWDFGYNTIKNTNEKSVVHPWEIDYTIGEEWEKKHAAIFAQTLTGGLLSDHANREEYSLFMQEVTTLVRQNREESGGIISREACHQTGTCPPPSQWLAYWDNVVTQMNEPVDDTLIGINHATQTGEKEYYKSVFATVCGATNDTMLHCKV